MKIKSLEISGIGGIAELNINFKDGLNVICGSNGVGKTTIIDVISDAFTNNIQIVRRNTKYAKGRYSLKYCLNGNEKISLGEITEINSKGDLRTETKKVDSDEVKAIMLFRDQRSGNYIPPEIRMDKDVFTPQPNQTIHQGISEAGVKNWFVNRYLFYRIKESLSEVEVKNLEQTMLLFQLIDPDISFKSIDHRTFDVKLNSSRGEVYMDHLSSGYRACVGILMGLMQEIDQRFNNLLYKDFEGLIVVDEVDLHLHPNWQAKIVEGLKRTFPRAQLILTTHSPSILQSLGKDEIIPLALDENNNTIVKELNLGQYGLQGWTLEEILTDVMDMPRTSSELFQGTMDTFDKAMGSEDWKAAQENYILLDKMLHPNSTMRRLLRIQMAGVGE